MTDAEARELCRGLFLETLDSLHVPPRLRQVMRIRYRKEGIGNRGQHDQVLEVGKDSYPLSRFHAIRMASFGKAAIEMAETADEILRKRGEGTALRGIVVAPYSGQGTGNMEQGTVKTAPSRSRLGFPVPGRLPGLEYFQAGHPYPDQGSWRAAEAVLAFLGESSPNELVLFLISGGGSALLEKPLHPSVSLEDIRRFYEILVTCGASIEEINILRKHFSAVKGGRLAERAAPATQITLYVSDVPEHLPSAVASGPTMPDESILEDCRRIAAHYGIFEKFPESIRALLQSGQLQETPKPGHPSFAQSRYYCLLSNRDGIEKLLQLAKARGVWADSDISCDEWQFQRAADYLLTRLETLREQHPGRPVLLVSGGELSCPVPGGGRGGRNQAFVLHCVSKIAGQPLVVLSAGTDGIDGNSPASGAIADGRSADRAAALGLDPEEFLSRGDSYTFFEKLGDAIVTGPTGTNVRDLRILLAYS